MRILLSLAAAAGSLFILGSTANAMPVAAAQEQGSLVTSVRAGCGPGFQRGPRGVCHRAVAPKPHRARCWVERTPRGPRRICR